MLDGRFEREPSGKGRRLQNATIRELFVELAKIERVLDGPDEASGAQHRKRHADATERRILDELHRRSERLPDGDAGLDEPAPGEAERD